MPVDETKGRTWAGDDGAPEGGAEGAPAVGERYRLAGTFGTGGMGRVDELLDVRLDRHVARKVLRPGRTDAASLLRFEREARVLASLEHPNIVPVYDLVDGPEGPELLMRAVTGRSLDEVLRAAELPSLRERLEVFLRVCDAVAYAHGRGVVHRDLKPANVMLGAYGEVLVVDWGLARVIGEGEPAGEAGATEDGDDRLTRQGQVLGTVAYMAPEQARGDTAGAGPASDQYALGVILYELLTGRTAFGGSTLEETLEHVRANRFRSPREVVASVPRELEVVTLRAMAAAPSARHASVQALRGEIAAYLAGEPLASVAYTRGERLARWAKLRRRGIRWTGVGVVVALLVVAVQQARHAETLVAARAAEAEARRGEETAHQETLRQLVEARIREADQASPTDPGLRRTTLLEARAIAARLGGADEAVETRLSLLDQQSPPPLVRWAAHPGGLPIGVAASPDGTWAVTWARDGELAAWALPRLDGQKGQGGPERSAVVEELWRRRWTGAVGGGFAPDGARVAAVVGEGAAAAVEVYRADRDGVGERLARFGLGEGPSIAGLLVVDGGAEVVVVRAGEALHHERYSLAGVRLPGAAGLPMTQRRASTRRLFGMDGSASKFVVDVRSGGRQGPFQELLAIDDEGFTAWSDNTVTSWRHGAATPDWALPAPRGTEGVVLRAAGMVAIFVVHAAIDLRALGDGSLVARLPVPQASALTAVGGRGILAVDTMGGASLWPVGALRMGPPVPIGLRTAAWSSDGRWAAVTTGTGVVVRDTSPDGGLRELRVPAEKCRGVAFLPGRERVYLACASAGLFEVPLDGSAPVQLLPWPGARLLAAAGPTVLRMTDLDGGTRTFDVQSGEASPRAPLHTGTGWALAVDPASGRALSTGRDQRDRRVLFWHGDGVIDAAPATGGVPFGAAIDPAHDWAGVTDDRGRVSAWSWSDPTRALPGFAVDGGVLTGLAAGGGRVATVGLTPDVRLFTEAGRSLGRFDARSEPIVVAFDPGGRRLLWALPDGPVRLLDLGFGPRLAAADAALAADPGDPDALAEAVRVRWEALDLAPPP